MNSSFNYGIDKLTAGIALQICNGNLQGVINSIAKEKIIASQSIVDNIAQGTKAVYGINTGFGPLCDTQISSEDTGKLQHNILKSHSVGVGEDAPLKVSKLMLILKLQALAQGFSGIALSTLERINWHIEKDIIPIIPQQGSVGASGDLAPLAHLFLPLIGLGKVHYKGEVKDAMDVLKSFGLDSLQLGAKEGLALINGTQFIAAYGIRVLESFHHSLNHADILGAMMVEGLLGSPSPFLKVLHDLRPYKGTQHVAHRLHSLLQGSEIVQSHENCDRVQDPYSLRCIPQVHGASRNAWLHLKETLDVELNAVTDNPIIINQDLSISGGNFHGQPMALPLDYACFAAAELGNISDRRIYLSITGIAAGVPKLLMKETGINSAFMMLQYTTAALASENKTMCFPASADSIPTSLGQEDHVSMGSISGRKAMQVLKNVEHILAIEMIYAAQAFDYHKPLKSGLILNEVHDLIRSKITHAEEDRVFADDIKKAHEIIKSNEVLHIAKKHAEKTGLISEQETLFEL